MYKVPSPSYYFILGSPHKNLCSIICRTRIKRLCRIINNAHTVAVDRIMHIILFYRYEIRRKPWLRVQVGIWSFRNNLLLAVYTCHLWTGDCHLWYETSTKRRHQPNQQLRNDGFDIIQTSHGILETWCHPNILRYLSNIILYTELLQGHGETGLGQGCCFYLFSFFFHIYIFIEVFCR